MAAKDDEKGRKKALDLAVSQIEKQFGSGSIMRQAGTDDRKLANR